MKKLFLKPGFEFIFCLSLLAILGLPTLMFAQTTRDVQINIQNGDTTVNGKNIKELPYKQRQEALKDITNISNSSQTTSTQRQVVIDNNTADTAGNGPLAANGKAMKFHRRKTISKDSTMSFSYRFDNGNNNGPRRMEGDFHFNRPDDGPFGFDRRNTQNFVYTNTDKEGVSTRVSFHVSEPSGENLRRIGHFEGALLDITDLNLVPQFSSGKTMLTFGLPAKTAAEVQLKDSEGNIVWTEKTSGAAFSKSFVIGLNGIYYLQVKQGGKVAVKKIFKEQ
jgi:hypothetical protein